MFDLKGLCDCLLRGCLGLWFGVDYGYFMIAFADNCKQCLGNYMNKVIVTRFETRNLF